MLETTSVAEWMTTPVITVEPNTPLKTAHELMKQYAIRRLPVVRNGRLVGIVTIGDVREAEPSDATSLSIWELNYLWDQLTVEQIMSHKVITVKAEDSILEAARLMLEHKISGLPVVNAQGTIAGILTESDIFKMLVESRTRVTTE
jgi:CBS domain-containing protein